MGTSVPSALRTVRVVSIGRTNKLSDGGGTEAAVTIEHCSLANDRNAKHMHARVGLDLLVVGTAQDAHQMTLARRPKAGAMCQHRRTSSSAERRSAVHAYIPS